METRFKHADREVIVIIWDALENNGYECSDIEYSGNEWWFILY